MNRKPDTNERVNKTTTAKRDALVSIAIIVFCTGVLRRPGHFASYIF